MAQSVLSNLEVVRPINSETYTAQTYNFLRAAILKRELCEGEVYSQDQISTRLNISRTPVREALLALQKEGYIRFLRGRGFEVVPYDNSDVNNIAEARLIVEKGAAVLATRRATEQQIAQLEQNIAAQRACIESEGEFDSQLFIQLDESFHREILEASCNNRLSKITDDMRSQWIRSGYMILHYKDNRHEILNEHAAIFSALRERDAEAAEAAMAKHLDNTRVRHHK